MAGGFLLVPWTLIMFLVTILGAIALDAPAEGRLSLWLAGCFLAWIGFYFVVPNFPLVVFRPIAPLLVCIDGPLILLWSLLFRTRR